MNVNDDLRILKSGDRFLWTSWRDGHTHIYLYSFNAPDPMAADAKLERQLESGDYEVIAVSGVDESASTVFFMRAVAPENPLASAFQTRSHGQGAWSASISSGSCSSTRPVIVHRAGTM